MNLNIENDKMRDALLIANEAYNLGLISRLDLWTDEGRNAVRNGEMGRRLFKRNYTRHYW